MCGRLAGMVQDRAPAFVGDVVVDELLDAVVTLLRRGPAHLLPMLDIVILEIGCQCSEIGHRHASLCGRERWRLTWWACGHGIALMTEVGIRRSDDLADHPRPPGDFIRAVRLRVLRGKSAKQIGTADNSNDAVVAHDRHPFYPIFLKEAGDSAASVVSVILTTGADMTSRA